LEFNRLNKSKPQKVKNSPDAFPHFQIINGLAFVLKLREANGTITISKNQLSGELKFFLETDKNERDI